MKMYEEFFYNRLVELRNKKGVSARDMSLSIGQNPGYINGIENRKGLPSLSAFFYICDYLGVTPKEFFDEEVSYPARLEELCENAKALSEEKLILLNTLVKYLI